MKVAVFFFLCFFLQGDGQTMSSTPSPTPVCPKGSFCPYSAAFPYLCPPGYYGASTGLTSSTCSGPCTASPGYGCRQGSTSLANATLCPTGFFCTGGTPAAAVPCTVPSLCTGVGITIDPPCNLGWSVGTFSGKGTNLPFSDGVSTVSTFYNPSGLSSDNSGNIYVSDTNNCKIRLLSPSGTSSTLAGTSLGFSDGAGALAKFQYPYGLAFDPISLVLYAADSSNHRIRRVTPSGVTTTFVGSGASTWIGDGTGTSTNFNFPYGVAVDQAGVVFVSDNYNNRIRRVTPLGVTTTLAGDGSTTIFNHPYGIAVDSRGIVFVSDFLTHRIKTITPTGVVSTLAGSGALAWADGTGAAASFNYPWLISLTAAGNLVVCDEFNSRIRLVSPGGTVTTLAGQSAGYQDGVGTIAKFSDHPYGVHVDSKGVIYVGDFNNNRVRSLTCLSSGVTPTSSRTPSSSPTPSGSPTASVSPTGSGSPTGKSRTPSATPTSTVTPTFSPTPSFTPSPSSSSSSTPSASIPIATSSPSPNSSPSASVSTSPTPTSTPSVSKAALSTPSSTTTETPTPTPTSTTSPTPTPFSTPVMALTPTATPSVSGSPSFTSTPTPTPPPFSCLSRREGCSTPFLSPSAPQLPLNGLVNSSSLQSFTTPIPVASFPFLAAVFTLTLPALPSSGESLTLTCNANAQSVVAINQNGGVKACLQSTFPGGCVTITLSSLSSPTTPLVIKFSVSLLSNVASPTTALLSCTLTSTPSLSSTSGYNANTLPRYGSSTTLASPLILLPSNPTQITAIVKGSLNNPTLFTSFAGLPAGVNVTLPLFARDFQSNSCNSIVSSVGGSSNRSSPAFPHLSYIPWNSSTLQDCQSAMEAIESIASSGLLSTLNPPPFSSILSGSATLLLLTTPSAAFPPLANLAITLGGIPLTLNWVSPNRTVLSVTTPTLSALCTNAVSLGLITSSSGDCGVSTLLLSHNSFGLFLTPSALSTAVASLSPLFIPSAYPPLSPSMIPPSASVLTTASTLVGYTTLPSMLSAALALSPPTLGIRLVAQCSDPIFATPEECAISIDGKQPNLPVGLTCPWGSGDGCVSCPTGALCPGGAQIYPLPGHWISFIDSPPDSLVSCPNPDPSIRCPGYVFRSRANANTTMFTASDTRILTSSSPSACGVGYTGRGCAACAPSFFPRAGNCVACPTSSLTFTLLIPILVFIGGLLGVGMVLSIMLYVSLFFRERKKNARGGLVGKRGGEEDTGQGGEKAPASPNVTFLSTVPSVGELLVWLWIAAQGASSLFIQAQGVAPSSLATFYGFLGALQFQGISVDPVCISSTPFLSFWLTVAFLGASFLLICVALVFLRCLPLVTTLYRLSTTTLYLTTLALLLGYGAVTSVFAGALTCNIATKISLLDYVTMKSDGKSLVAALGPSAPSIGALRAAVANPLLPTNIPLTQLLRSTYIPVSTLASDPFQVCAEGVHTIVWYVAMVCTIFFTLGFPLLGVASLWSAGKLKGLRKALNFVRLWGKSGELAVKASHKAPLSTPTNGTILLNLHTALKDETLKRNVAWYSYWEMGVLALYTGLVGMSKRTRTREGYSVTQGGIIAAAAVSIALLWRVQPFVAAHAWKRFPSGALHGLTAFTALINTLIVYHSGGGASQFALGIAPLAYATFLGCAIIMSWWINTFYFGDGGKRKGEKASSFGNTQAEAQSSSALTPTDFSSHNPLNISIVSHSASAPATIASPPWSRARDGKDMWWVQEVTGISAWELPSGATTTCGWVHTEREGIWTHSPSGAVSKTPSPLDESPSQDPGKDETVLEPAVMTAVDSPSEGVISKTQSKSVVQFAEKTKGLLELCAPDAPNFSPSKSTALEEAVMEYLSRPPLTDFLPRSGVPFPDMLEEVQALVDNGDTTAMGYFRAVDHGLRACLLAREGRHAAAVTEMNSCVMECDAVLSLGLPPG